MADNKRDLVEDLQTDEGFKSDLVVLINFIGGREKVKNFAEKVRTNKVPAFIKNLLR